MGTVSSHRPHQTFSKTTRTHHPLTPPFQSLPSSPLLASVNYLSLRNSSLPVPSDPPIVPESSNDALRRLVTASKREVRPPAGWDEDGDEPTGASSRGSAARRKWLSNKANREAVVLDKDWEVGIEFANGLLGWSTFLSFFLGVLFSSSKLPTGPSPLYYSNR
jgi:hypothetical protein